MRSVYLQIALLWIGVLICHFVYLVPIAAFARWRGIVLLAVSVGIGPKVFQRGVFVIKLLPTSGFVRMLDAREAHVEPEQLHASFNMQPRWVRATQALVGPLALLALALLLRGVDGWRSFARAFGQLLGGTVSPTGEGAALASGFLAVVGNAGVLTLLGTIAAKFAAINLLPIPPLAGWSFLRQWFVPAGASHESERFDIITQQVGLCALLALMAAWLWIFVSALT